MEITKTEVYGFRPSFRGMRNPMDSWDKADSECLNYYEDVFIPYNGDETFIMGDNDKKLAQKLILAGTEHCKFLRQIQVWCDIKMPRYWWSEFDTYKFTEKNSCSTMHKLLNKQAEISIDMFEICPEDIDIAVNTIQRLNEIRDIWIKSTTQKEKDYCIKRAKCLLPEGFLQLRTVNTNYQELRNIYFQRRNHRLKDEWVNTFCKWVESLPYAKELITLEKLGNKQI